MDGVQSAASMSPRKRAPKLSISVRKEKTSLSSRWWRELGTGEKVLAIIGALSLIATICAIPGVNEWLGLKAKGVGFKQNSAPARGSVPGSSGVQPKPQIQPLPNSPMPYEEYRKLYSYSPINIPPPIDIKPFKFTPIKLAVIYPSTEAQKHLVSQGDVFSSIANRSIESGGVPVSFWLSIDTDGKVLDVTPIDGTPVAAPVITAIKQWRYKPFVFDGSPVIARTVITVNLSHADAPSEKPK